MTVENKKAEVKEEKKLLCPFNPDPNFNCENCRLFIHYTDGRQDRVCAFIRVAD